jgi:hypothetical protein
MLHKGLLKDIYSTYGHHFSDTDMADAADLSQENQQVIYAMAQRHVHAITELAKSENELTEVYHLALDTMKTLADPSSSGIQYRQHLKNCKAYRHFWRIAINKILVKDRPRRIANIKAFKD